MTFQSKPVLNFGNAEIFVVNTFLHVGPLLSEVARCRSEPAKNTQDVPMEPQSEDPVMPWKTYDSYEQNYDEDELYELGFEPMVHKVSTLEYFERVQAFERLAVEKVSTYDWFEDAPLVPYDAPEVATPETAGIMESVNTYDSFEDAQICPGGLANVEAIVPEDQDLSGADAPLSPDVTPSNASPLTSSIKGGKELIRWRVDGRKLETQEKQILSPEFDLKLPGLEPAPFRLMILAKETRGKGGKGFLKAKGYGRLFIKCVASSLPEGIEPVSFRVTVGHGADNDLPAHQFSEHSCCPLQEGNMPWDLLSRLSSSKRLEVSVQVL
mmetsp:Transcript_108647/g.132596  ORF Transcript_108647/g.132596 Transcript_108647/m.132596 type:complete len:325 (-) Transcript_108647:157-1131(-)